MCTVYDSVTLSFREVSKQDGLSLAARHSVPFVEVSAAEEPEAVDKLFREAIRQGLNVQVMELK